MYGEDDHCRAKLVQVYRFTRCAATLVRSSLNLLVASCLCNIFSLFTVRCSARHASAVYATVILSVILSIHLSVCLSVTLVYCIRAKWLNKRVFFERKLSSSAYIHCVMKRLPSSPNISSGFCRFYRFLWYCHTAPAYSVGMVANIFCANKLKLEKVTIANASKRPEVEILQIFYLYSEKTAYILLLSFRLNVALFRPNLYYACAQTAISQLPVKILIPPLVSSTRFPTCLV